MREEGREVRGHRTINALFDAASLWNRRASSRCPLRGRCSKQERPIVLRIPFRVASFYIYIYIPAESPPLHLVAQVRKLINRNPCTMALRGEGRGVLCPRRIFDTQITFPPSREPKRPAHDNRLRYPPPRLKKNSRRWSATVAEKGNETVASWKRISRERRNYSCRGFFAEFSFLFIARILYNFEKCIRDEDSVYLNLVLLIYGTDPWRDSFLTRIGVIDTRRKLNAVIREDVGYRIWKATRFIYIYIY